MENLTGKQLGPYRITAPLGEGGMAAVYKAYQPGMDRYVAMKILPRHFADDPEFVGRFEQEAKLIAKLQHVHILPVHDYGEAESYTYIVMPYVETGTLADLLQGDPLPTSQVNSIIAQVGDALDYAHECDVVHRDVKPSNMLIDHRGNCLLTDFGIAKMVEGTAQFTQTGAIIGTPAYMSPEQILGGDLDGRSDIYSLGVVLFEMATGRQPYRAETPPAIFVKHLNDPLPIPRTINPDISQNMEKVILKALAKDRNDRYLTAADLSRAVENALRSPEHLVAHPGDQTTEPYPGIDLRGAEVLTAAPSDEASRRAKRSWILLGTGAVAAIALAVGGFLGLRELADPSATPLAPTAIPTSLAATENLTLPPAPTGAPLSGPTEIWRYRASDVIWQLDSWGDGFAAGDLDGDGVPDIVFGTQDGAVVSLNGADGAELWSKTISTRVESPVEADIVDLDRDGFPEVIAAGAADASSEGQALLVAFDGDGSVLWQTTSEAEAIVDLAYGEVNGDTILDVIVSAGTYPWGGGSVEACDGATGERIWSQPLGRGQAQGIDAQDADLDGKVEIVVENYDDRVFMLSGDTGEILWSQPKAYHGRDVRFADLDADGTLEIVSVVANVTAYAADGRVLWSTERGGDFLSSADLSGDELPEIIYSSAFEGDLHVINGLTGEELWSVPRSGVHVVGDVDGDGAADLVVGTVRYYGLEPPYAVRALDGEGNLLWEFPLATIFNEQAFAIAVANLDQDPATEVLVANGRELIALDPPG